jgi:hypothetical protein
MLPNEPICTESKVHNIVTTNMIKLIDQFKNMIPSDEKIKGLIIDNT